MRFHALEVEVKYRQLYWIEDILRGTSAEFSNMETELPRHQHALNVLKIGLSYHITRLLNSPDISLAERALLFQILPELGLAYTTSPNETVCSWSSQTPEELWDLVESLSRSGDTGGAILLIHSPRRGRLRR